MWNIGNSTFEEHREFEVVVYKWEIILEYGR